MSWWIQKEDKDGKQKVWAIDVDPLTTIMVLATLAIIVVPKAMNDPVSVATFSGALMSGGLICLVVSKTSLFRQGIWFSFGPSLMSKGFARLYKLGYVLILVGLLLLLLVLKLAT